MSDPSTNQPPASPAPSTPPAPTPPVPPAPVIQPPQPTPPAPAPAAGEGGETDWKAEARKWESRAKENSDAATRLKEIEDAQKTEQEKLAEQLQEARSTGEVSQGELARLRAALAKAPPGMDPATVLTWSDRLRGATAEELEKDAEELFKQFAPAPPARGQRPMEALRTVPLATSGDAQRTDMNEWMRQQAQPNR